MKSKGHNSVDISTIKQYQHNYISLQNLFYENEMQYKKQDGKALAQKINFLREIVQSYFEDKSIRKQFEKELLNECHADSSSSIEKCFIHARQLDYSEIKLINGIQFLVVQDSDNHIQYEVI